MITKEFRIVLPITVEEYHVAHRWSVAEESRNVTGGYEGVEIITNEKRGEGGQYTRKIFHFESRLPRKMVRLSISGDTEIHEVSRNTFPTCITEVSNSYMNKNFGLVIKSRYLPDLGDSENVHNLPEDEWKATEVVKIDIANTAVRSSDYKAEFDPLLVKSEKAQRGPLSKNWIEELRAKKEQAESSGNPQDKPAYMCAYKLVTCEFKWWGLQETMERRIMEIQQRLFVNFHRQEFCWMDKWYGLKMDDIVKIEEKLPAELHELRNQGSLKGMMLRW